MATTSVPSFDEGALTPGPWLFSYPEDVRVSAAPGGPLTIDLRYDQSDFLNNAHGTVAIEVREPAGNGTSGVGGGLRMLAAAQHHERPRHRHAGGRHRLDRLRHHARLYRPAAGPAGLPSGLRAFPQCDGGEFSGPGNHHLGSCLRRGRERLRRAAAGDPVEHPSRRCDPLRCRPELGHGGRPRPGDAPAHLCRSRRQLLHPALATHQRGGCGAAAALRGGGPAGRWCGRGPHRGARRR